MLDQVLEFFSITPDFDLNLMSDNQTTAHIASAVLDRLPNVIQEVRPDIVLVQGDTMTTFAASLSAYLLRVKVGHIEAGLRTGDFDHPFPEEMNRCLTTRLSNLHFAPTSETKAALIAERVTESDIYITGNTVIDALLSTVSDKHQFAAPELRKMVFDRPLILATTHRRESFGAPMRDICSAIATIAERKPEFNIVLPVHPNPDVRSTVSEFLGDVENVLLTEPLGYADFANLMARSHIILTDSGGVQEEAPALNVPVLVLRDTTERPEGLDAGASLLVGTNQENIVSEAMRISGDSNAYAEMAAAKNPYGDGMASSRIAEVLTARMSPRD